MKRIAIFVEGQTEQIFVSKLIQEIAGGKDVFLISEKWKNDKSGKRCFTAIDAEKRCSFEKYYVLIRDCGGDSTVKSDILDSYKKLAQSGYEKIIGLRDVYPASIVDVPKLKRWLLYGIPTRDISINMLLAVMEIEAWFLADSSHFEKIHPDLTLEVVSKVIGFNPKIENVELREHPAQDMDDIYKTVGYRYSKKRRSIQRTVDALDYCSLYLELPNKVSSLKDFIECVDEFLT